MSESPQGDLDPNETREWLESIDSVLKAHGPERAHFLLERLIDYTRRSGAYLPFKSNTAYLNSISPGQQPDYPGNRELERRIEAYIRWNAMAMVVQANRISSEYGGHIATYASAATLYEVGFNHFWRAPTDQHPGDMIYVQGHASPGIYARAYLEGRLTEDQLRHFRQEVAGDGLSSYPHPWLMPDFWQFPTVSMGLGPMQAIFQARFQRYLEHRGLVTPTDRKIWAFLGDGEMDEPESMGALTMPVREKLDNLVFVINCNLQRLDGPVRGNGKIIQELEAAFLGAGWNVIKVLWGSRWDPLLAKDNLGLLRRVMEESVDGEYQNFKAKGGAYTREHFFGKFDELKAMVANMSDDEIWRLNRGGHDPRKVYAAYAAAMQHKGQPTVILAKTVKGFGMGKAGEGQMVTHQQKKLSDDDLRHFRDRFNIPVSDEEIAATVLQARRRRRGAELSALASYFSRRLSAGPAPLGSAARRAAARDFQAAAREQRGPRHLDHHGVRAHADHAAQRQADRSAYRAHRSGRGAYLRHGRALQAGRNLFFGRSALHAAGCRSAHVLS
jgi:pyruvate dehydrogenase E1 component